ncbi:hypothetical protein BS50DRAFT_215865 [Corynespora cassiicola Philippines]|uniref:Uncharacterized protein n=1 Tax=Corynespora cassiicola Philippines TaxID=1448308 RepID=A0A2T2N3F8_CORCC|nr:hypothetical protein BS50DRAFT_215865 [Corynespora cassiicola Philippines]
MGWRSSRRLVLETSIASFRLGSHMAQGYWVKVIGKAKLHLWIVNEWSFVFSCVSAICISRASMSCFCFLVVCPLPSCRVGATPRSPLADTPIASGPRGRIAIRYVSVDKMRGELDA